MGAHICLISVVCALHFFCSLLTWGVLCLILNKNCSNACVAIEFTEFKKVRDSMRSNINRKKMSCGTKNADNCGKLPA
ncbi:hypothetical protein Wcon_01364 [Wolbachia endosymbiont of Cylisticus convexus]|nr:hypothetical protein Wcon_01364 [Wolbachia endosymbiont of Cylisticus convexus]